MSFLSGYQCDFNYLGTQITLYSEFSVEVLQVQGLKFFVSVTYSAPAPLKVLYAFYAFLAHFLLRPFSIFHLPLLKLGLFAFYVPFLEQAKQAVYFPRLSFARQKLLLSSRFVAAKLLYHATKTFVQLS